MNENFNPMEACAGRTFILLTGVSARVLKNFANNISFQT